MPDNIKDIYNLVSKSNIFVDEDDFRKQVNLNPKEVFDFISKDKNFKGLFVDFNDFQDNLKKKVGGEVSSLTEFPSASQEYLDKGQELAEGGFIKKIGEPDHSQLISQYKSPDISLTQKPKKDYYSTKLEKGLIFDKEGQLYAPSSEALSKDITAAEKASLKKSTQKDLVEKSREMPVVEPTEEQGLLLNLVSSLDKGFAKNFISSPIKGLGTFLQGTTKKVLGGSGEGAASNALIKFGDYLNNAIDEITPQDEEFKGTLWDQAAQALGQVGSLILTGGLTGAPGKAATLAAQAPKSAAATAASRIASQLSAPTSVSAGLSMGQAEFDRAKEAGATDDQAFEAFYKNAVTGSVLETIPVMQFFKRFNKSTAGGLVNYLKTKGVAGFTGGVEEMTTEILQQLYANKTAKDIYNINQSILDGVGSSGGVGFGVGFLLNAMGANARILRKQGKMQDAIAIENQIEQYEDNLKNPKVTSGNTAKDIVTQGVELGTQKAVQDLDRDLANNVITPEKYQEEIVFAEKAAQVADKIPETVTGESRVKSVELLVERNDIKQANDNLIQQKQASDEAYHAGIDEEIKANEERIKKIDSEVYNIAKKPSKDFGGKKYILNGEEVSQAEFEALQGKPIGTKEIITAEVKPEEVKVTEEVKPTEVKVTEEVKPTEVKEEAITKSKFKKPINQELLETIPEKNISDVVEKIDNGKAELNVDVFPATDLGTDNKITNNQIVYLLHSQGKEIGVLTVNNETLGNRSESSIAGVVLHPDVKGKGIGKEIYRFVNNDLINKGKKPLKSDFDITPDAINVWKSLVKSGEAREVGVAKNGKPLFEMNKPTEVKAEVVKPKVEKKVEPKILSIDNKEYTTKTGRQKVVLKDNDLKVIDIKTGKETSPATRRKALDEYVERYDFSKGKTAQENTKESPEGLSSEEVDRFTIEQSENPLEVASAYIYEEPISKFSGSKDAMIAEFGVGKVTQESFKRWKDENLITGGMALTYFNKKEGTPLDVLAKEMSDHYGKEIDPQDIADFIVKYPSGSSAALRDIESPTGRMAAERFKELTGLDLYRGMAEKIVKAEYEKIKQIEKDLIKEEYETAKQLEDAYWAAYKETDGFTKESPVSEVKPSEATEKGVEEAYKDLTINQKRQIINSKFDELLKELKIEKICPT
jgi:hypothetical protein